jgi:hypothetical protein
MQYSRVRPASANASPARWSQHPIKMPVCEVDPWRFQFFEQVPCPEHVRIPTEDADAWEWNPAHRHVYDKLHVALSQGLAAAPHGVMPPHWPVFSKPVINLKGMGRDSRRIDTAADYAQAETPGHMWAELLEGDHVSTDAAVVDGEVRWWRHATGRPIGGGMFDYWTIHAGALSTLEAHAARWIARQLAGYTGMVNLETIGGRIIEAHLRFADQWPDLYGGNDWVRALVGLYSGEGWSLPREQRRDGYSLALFVPHPGLTPRHPPAGLVREVLAHPAITSVQITFHEDRAPEAHTMPPGGFRVAIVNTFDLAAGRAARRRLAEWFGEVILA